MAESVGIHGDGATDVDELDRHTYVSALADVITGGETPLTVAIYGSWGSGKTSMMLQLRKALGESRDGTRLRSVWFDPWMHQFDDNPALAMLHATTEQLGLGTDRAVRSALAKLAVAVGEDIEVPFLGLRVGRLLKIRDEIANDELRRREERTRFRSHFETIVNRALSGSDRVVFFIDDLDRCQPEVALTLLESLKLYLDFPGCVFVLGVDREPLEAAVSARYSQLGLTSDSYLDKIIQLPFVIPAIDRSAMLTFVESQIPSDLHSCADLLALAAADDPRSVKRMANTLLLNHRLAEATPFDAYEPRLLALVILIQAHAPSLYRQLRLSPELIHSLRPDAAQDASPSLWDEYMSPKPRLAAAVESIAIAPDLDLTPYLTLSTHSFSSFSSMADERERGRIFLATSSPNSMAYSLIGLKLEELGWVVDTQPIITRLDAQSQVLQSITGADFVLAVFDGISGSSSRSTFRNEIRVASELGVPIVPVIIGDASGFEFRSLEGELAPLRHLQFVSVDPAETGPGLAALERALSRFAPS